MVLTVVLLFLVWILPSEGKMVCHQREQSQLLKFLASLLVVLGHQAAFYGIGNDLLARETSVGNLCVAFFLFMSGYGLLYGLLSKKQHLTMAWIGKRMVKLIVPAITAMGVYVIAEIVIGRKVDWVHLFTYWFLSDINLRYGWYVTEIIILYLLFYVTFRHFAPKAALAVVCAIVFFAITVLVITKAPIWFILGLPCFIMGLLLAYYDMGEMKTTLCMSTRKMKFMMSVAVLFFFTMKHFYLVVHIVPVLDKWRYVYVSNYLCNIVFIIIIIYILMRLPVCMAMVNRGGVFLRNLPCPRGYTSCV